MNSKPQHIALYTATIITLFYSVLFIAVSLVWYQMKWVPFAVSALLMFGASYFVVRYFLNRFIYEKIKLIYKTIGAFGSAEEDPDIRHKSLDEVNTEVKEWGEKQKEEIKKLKQTAAYRREFLGNISHELKTPIFNIQGYILTLLDGGLEDDTINRTFLKKANKSIKRMIAIVEDLEEISKLESGVAKPKLTTFDFYELIKEVADFMEMKAAKNNAEIEIYPSTAGSFPVSADKKRYRQVLINLIDNAVKYGNKKRTTVKISVHDLDTKYLIEVSDNGPGIEEKNLPRVFERFYRTDAGRSRDKGGTGLGLAIVKHIIEAHRQTISVKSKEGEGTSFLFTVEKAANAG